MLKTSDEKITREDILGTLRAAFEREEPIILSAEEKPVSMFSSIVEVRENAVDLKNPIPPAMLPYILTAKSYTLVCRSFWLKTAKLIPHGKHIRFPVVEFGKAEHYRNSERVYFSDRENAVVEIQHPFDSSTVLSRRIFDLSSGGMSFRARLNTPFLLPGRLLPCLKICVNGELREQHKGKVVYVKQIIDTKGESYFQVGVRFVDEENAETSEEQGASS